MVSYFTSDFNLCEKVSVACMDLLSNHFTPLGNTGFLGCSSFSGSLNVLINVSTHWHVRELLGKH